MGSDVESSLHLYIGFMLEDLLSIGLDLLSIVLDGVLSFIFGLQQVAPI